MALHISEREKRIDGIIYGHLNSRSRAMFSMVPGELPPLSQSVWGAADFPTV
jgi:hypothetical protein